MGYGAGCRQTTIPLGANRALPPGSIVPKISIVIPSDVDFADLHLARNADGMVSFRWEPIEAICEASDVDIEVFRDSPEDNLGALLSHWYHAHLAGGGDRDPTYDEMIAEAEAEDRLGGGFSHQPGRA